MTGVAVPRPPVGPPSPYYLADVLRRYILASLTPTERAELLARYRPS